MTESNTEQFIELTKAAWPKDVCPSSQAWFTDKLNEACTRLGRLRGCDEACKCIDGLEAKIEQQQELIRRLESVLLTIKRNVNAGAVTTQWIENFVSDFIAENAIPKAEELLKP